MDNNFIFMTDDSCDLPDEYLKSHDIKVIRLSYIIDSTVYKANDLAPEEFYSFLRMGKMPVTSQVNAEDARAFMEPFLKDGKDIFYAAFSSGLSGTCNSGMVAAEELRGTYPERKIIVVDTLCASMGQGLMVYKLQRMREQGASMEEMAKWTEDNRLNVAHLVGVDDLMHLHRGGRVSRLSAIAGSVLGIKPVIHMNNEGKLIVIDKIRGRKQVLANLVDKLEERMANTANDYFMVSHADCEQDARFVAELMSKRFGVKDYMINFIGPVIGSHTGPGVIAAFIMTDHR